MSSFTYSHIYVQCGLNTGQPDRFLVGNMAELVDQHFRCLGLLALPELPEHAKSAMGPFAEKLFSKGPFTTIERMFDEAWETAAAGDCLAWLSRSYQLAILVEPPIALPQPSVDSRDPQSYEAAVRAAMREGWDYSQKVRQQLRSEG